MWVRAIILHSFDDVKNKASENWNQALSKIEIETPDPGNYTLIVTHKGTLEGDNPFVGGNQNFGLVISGANFQSSLGISSFDDANNLMIWPNPANDILNYSFISSTDSNAIINLYDSQGRLVYEKTKKSIINNARRELLFTKIKFIRWVEIKRFITEHFSLTIFL